MRPNLGKRFCLFHFNPIIYSYDDVMDYCTVADSDRCLHIFLTARIVAESWHAMGKAKSKIAP